MTKHADLIASLEALTGPDREVDVLVGIATNLQIDGLMISLQDYVSVVGIDCVADASSSRTTVIGTGLPHYTKSIDAAVALCERVLPPMTDIVIKTYPGGKYHHAEIESDFGDFDGLNAPTPAIALLIATLKALNAKEQSDD